VALCEEDREIKEARLKTVVLGVTIEANLIS
jgi:hypothetical protein